MRFLAVLLSLLAILTLVPWGMVAPTSIMAFHAGESQQPPAIIGLLAAYPLWVLVWLLLVWSRLRRGTGGAATAFAIVALLPALFVGAVIAGTAVHNPLGN